MGCVVNECLVYVYVMCPGHAIMVISLPSEEINSIIHSSNNSDGIDYVSVKWRNDLSTHALSAVVVTVNLYGMYCCSALLFYSCS